VHRKQRHVSSGCTRSSYDGLSRSRRCM
jgi:hypothetical protein